MDQKSQSLSKGCTRERKGKTILKSNIRCLVVPDHAGRYGPRARALLFNRLRPKGLRVVPRPKFCAESENSFLTNGRWWVRREISIFG